VVLGMLLAHNLMLLVTVVTISVIMGGTQTEGVREQGAEENIWTDER
jgi:inosine-uridine nucleoside N-ribohydrolase